MGKSRARRCLFDASAEYSNSIVEDAMVPSQELTPPTTPTKKMESPSNPISYKAALLSPSSSEETTHYTPTQPSATTPITNSNPSSTIKKRKKKSKRNSSNTTQQQPTPKATNAKASKIDLLVDSPLHNSAERIIQRPSPSKQLTYEYSLDMQQGGGYSLWSGPASPFFSACRPSYFSNIESNDRFSSSLFSHNIFFEATQS